jgi:thiol-disulfide isomerase/thioredoxin
MIRVKVFGSTPPCARCKEAEKRAAKVAQRYPGQVEVSTFDAISDEGRKYGVMFTPTVVVNDSIAAQGRVISEGELEKAIKRELEGQS